MDVNTSRYYADVNHDGRPNPTPGLNPGVEPGRFAAWRNFVQANGIVLWLMRKQLADELGLPATWYEILLHVNDAPGGRLNLQTLQDLVVFSQSGLSQLITQMEAEGLVRRDIHPADARRAVVEVTSRGIDVLAEAAAVHKVGIERHFADLLSDEEAEVIATALGRVLEQARRCREASRSRPAPRRGRRRAARQAGDG